MGPRPGGSIALALAALLLAMAGCAAGAPMPSSPRSPSPSEWPIRTPAPRPSGAVALPLATQPPATPLPSGAAWACDSVGRSPTRIEWRPEQHRLLFISVGTRQPDDLLWPRGFAAWLQDGRVSLVAPDGTVIGRDGDTISGLNGGPLVCSIGATLYPPAR